MITWLHFKPSSHGQLLLPVTEIVVSYDALLKTVAVIILEYSVSSNKGCPSALGFALTYLNRSSMPVPEGAGIPMQSFKHSSL